MEKLTKQKAIQFMLEHPGETYSFYIRETGLSQTSIANYKKEIKEKEKGFSRNSVDEKLDKIISLITEGNSIESIDALAQENADLLEKIHILIEENNMLKEQINTLAETQEQ